MGEPPPHFRGKHKIRIRRHALNPPRGMVRPNRIIETGIDFNRVEKFREKSSFVKPLGSLRGIRVRRPVGIRPSRRPHPYPRQIVRRSTHPSQPMCHNSAMSTKRFCSGRLPAAGRVFRPVHFSLFPNSPDKQDRLKTNSANVEVVKYEYNEFRQIFDTPHSYSELLPTSPLAKLPPMRHCQPTRVSSVYPKQRTRVYPEPRVYLQQLRRAHPSAFSKLSPTTSLYRCAHETLSQFQGS
jgi:hypothetical protein